MNAGSINPGEGMIFLQLFPSTLTTVNMMGVIIERSHAGYPKLIGRLSQSAQPLVVVTAGCKLTQVVD